MLFPPNELVHVVELTANIWLAARSRLETRLRPLSMTWPQFGVLLALGTADGVTQRELSETLEIDRTTMSVICDSLEKHGWATRTPDPADRRANRIQLTDEGRAALASAQAVVWGAYADVADVLSSKEISSVVPKLERVYAAIKSIPDEPPAAAGEKGR